MKTRNYILILFTSIFFGKSHVSYSQICFTQVDTLVINTQPGSIISADFNGDGKADLATANGNANNVSVFLGTGTGSFSAPAYFAVGSSPRQVCYADFNGDGKIDLATANYVSNNISVLLGNGAGSFGLAINYAMSYYTESLCSADFNSDGKADLAVTTGNNYSNVSILLGNGAGSFSSVTNLPFGGPTGANKVINADFNNDGKYDLATSDGGTYQMTVFNGNGSGGFSAPTGYTASNTLGAIIGADFNGDNKADLVAAINNQVAVYINNGTGSFGSVTYFSTMLPTGNQSVSLCNADFNKDGKSDIASANYMANTISILVGTGTGSFAAPINYTVNTSPVSIVSADFNGDSMPDLATSNLNSNNVAILLNCSPVGINQYTTDDEQVIIYPNPASTIMSLSFKQIHNDNTEIKITNVLGEEVSSGKIEEKNNLQIDISNLQNGIYFVEVKTSKGIVTKKIVVQH